MNVLTLFVIVQHVHALMRVGETHFLHVTVADFRPGLFADLIAFRQPQAVMPDRIFYIRPDCP